jgi:hypothetical protein
VCVEARVDFISPRRDERKHDIDDDTYSNADEYGTYIV